MQNTAAAALRSIEGQLESYISGADGTGTPFSTWLASVNDYMHKGHVGCVGCSDLPSGASSASTDFQACPASGASAANQQPMVSNLLAPVPQTIPSQISQLTNQAELADGAKENHSYTIPVKS
jgi:hypothetical protein